jgi:GNAT superfamily N-acetyltransferase
MLLIRTHNHNQNRGRAHSGKEIIMSTNAPVEIVRADTGHADAVAALFDLYRQFYEQVPDLEGAQRFIRERLERGQSVIFLALKDGRGVGFTQLYPSFSSVSMRRLWILNDLYVAAEARTLGVGRALLERAREFAIETGAKGLELATATDNLAAQRLYEKTNWKKDLEFFHYYLYV